MWHKYPNPHCTHVATIDVVDRSVDPKTGIIRTERILGCKQKAPIWIVKVCFTLLSVSAAADGSCWAIYSCLAGQRMHLCEKSRSSTQQRKPRPLRPSTFLCPNSRRVTKTFGIYQHRMAERRSHKLQKYKHAWHCGGVRQTSWRTGWSNDSSRTRS